MFLLDGVKEPAPHGFRQHRTLSEALFGCPWKSHGLQFGFHQVEPAEPDGGLLLTLCSLLLFLFLAWCLHFAFISILTFLSSFNLLTSQLFDLLQMNWSKRVGEIEEDHAGRTFLNGLMIVTSGVFLKSRSFSVTMVWMPCSNIQAAIRASQNGTR